MDGLHRSRCKANAGGCTGINLLGTNHGDPIGEVINANVRTP